MSFSDKFNQFMHDLRGIRSCDLFLSPDVDQFPLTVIEFHDDFQRLDVSALDVKRSSVAVLILSVKKQHCVNSTIQAFGAVESVEYVMRISLLSGVVYNEHRCNDTYNLSQY